MRTFELLTLWADLVPGFSAGMGTGFSSFFSAGSKLEADWNLAM